MTQDKSVGRYTAKVRYLASVFVDARRAVATSRDVVALLGVLGDDRLLPTTMHEITQTGTMPRIAFNSADERVLLALTSTRFDYAVQSLSPDGDDLGSFAAFCKEAEERLTTALSHFRLRGHRLATVQEGYLDATSLEQIEHVMSRLLNRPPLYQESVPSEWNWRANTMVRRKISTQNEDTNLITSIYRVRGNAVRVANGAAVEQVEIDRVRMDIDINTVPTNNAQRFGKPHVRGFFSHSPKWHDEVATDVLNFIYPRQQ